MSEEDNPLKELKRSIHSKLTYSKVITLQTNANPFLYKLNNNSFAILNIKYKFMYYSLSIEIELTKKDDKYYRSYHTKDLFYQDLVINNDNILLDLYIDSHITLSINIDSLISEIERYDACCSII